MAKLTKGRFRGKIRGDSGLGVPEWEAIPMLSLADLYSAENAYEARLAEDEPADHPEWLRKRAARIRSLIDQKERAIEHRRQQ